MIFSVLKSVLKILFSAIIVNLLTALAFNYFSIDAVFSINDSVLFVLVVQVAIVNHRYKGPLIIIKRKDVENGTN